MRNKKLFGVSYYLKENKEKKTLDTKYGFKRWRAMRCSMQKTVDWEKAVGGFVAMNFLIL